jgi:hypothetical protein
MHSDLYSGIQSPPPHTTTDRAAKTFQRMMAKKKRQQKCKNNRDKLPEVGTKSVIAITLRYVTSLSYQVTLHH